MFFDSGVNTIIDNVINHFIEITNRQFSLDNKVIIAYLLKALP